MTSIATRLARIPERRAWALALGALAGAFALAFAAQKTILLADYPDWVYQGVVAHARVFSPGEATRYALKNYPVPNSFVSAAVAGLLSIAPPLAASHLLLVAYLAAFAFVLSGAACAISPDDGHAKALFLFPAIALGMPFWWGSLNYQFALLFFTAYLYCDASRRLSPLRLAALSILVFFCHAIVFMVLVAHAGLKGFLARRRVVVLALLPALGLALWYVVGRYVVARNMEQIHLTTDFAPTVANLLFYQLHMLLKLGPFHNLLTPDGRSFLAPFPALFWALFGLHGLYLALAAFAIAHRLPAQWRSAAFDGRYDTVFFLALGAASLIVPLRLLGVADFGQRMMILAFLGLCLRTPFTRAASRAACAIALLAALPALVFLFRASANPPPPLPPAPANGASDALMDRLLDAPIFARTAYYDSIRRRDFTRPIFPSGMLMDTRDSKSVAPAAAAAPTP